MPIIISCARVASLTAQRNVLHHGESQPVQDALAVRYVHKNEGGGSRRRTKSASAAKVDECPAVRTRPPEAVGGLHIAVRIAGGMQLLQPRAEVAQDHQNSRKIGPNAARPVVERFAHLHHDARRQAHSAGSRQCCT